MTKLVLSMDGLVLKEIELNKDRVTIGRRPSNDIQIDNLAISGEHAAVVTILNDSFLEDLDSTNGTLVNSQPVKKHILKNGDIVELGKYKLKYFVEESPDAQGYVDAPDAPDAVISQTTSLPPAPPTPDHTAASVGIIQVLSGVNAGRQLELTKTLTSLGKPGRQVAVIARRPEGYFITHVEGTEFPIVNGQTLDAQAHPINNHDVIEIAGVKMEFFLKE